MRACITLIRHAVLLRVFSNGTNSRVLRISAAVQAVKEEMERERAKPAGPEGGSGHVAAAGGGFRNVPSVPSIERGMQQLLHSSDVDMSCGLERMPVEAGMRRARCEGTANVMAAPAAAAGAYGAGVAAAAGQSLVRRA